jgi:hypothetical protein
LQRPKLIVLVKKMYKKSSGKTWNMASLTKCSITPNNFVRSVTFNPFLDKESTCTALAGKHLQVRKFSALLE